MPVEFSSRQFLGAARVSRETGDFALSHRIADTPAHQVETHSHADAHFVLVTGGAYVSTAAGESCRDRPLLVYNPPGTTHRDRFEPGLGSYFTVSVAFERTAQVLGEIAPPDFATRAFGPSAHALCARLVWLCGRWDADSALTAEALCHELLAELDPREQPRSPPAWLGAARELLCDRYGEPISMRKIADELGVHAVHLARSFRAFYRCTPGEYLRGRRLEAAAGLLAATSLPLAEVALACGFADQSHFTKAFRRTYAVSPGLYRRETRR